MISKIKYRENPFDLDANFGSSLGDPEPHWGEDDHRQSPRNNF